MLSMSEMLKNTHKICMTSEIATETHHKSKGRKAQNSKKKHNVH